MEVPGQLPNSFNENPILYCVPCERDGVMELAYGYCQDCEEHLCERCYQYHRKPRPSRNHVLLDKDSMPMQAKSRNIRSDEITDYCINHGSKLQEFFCNNHGCAACYVCMTLEHKHCNVDYIPNVSENVSDQLNDIIEKTEQLVKKCKSNVRIAEDTAVNLDSIYKKVAEDIKLYRKEINEYLDMIEAEITDELQSCAQEAKNKQDIVKAENLQIADEMSCSMTFLNSLNDEKRNNKLYIEMKNVERRLASLCGKERQIVKDNRTADIVTFIPNDSILDQFKNASSFGTIVSDRKPSAQNAVCFQYKRAITVKTVSDNQQSDITGMVMISPTHMAVADWSNGEIKMIDVDNGMQLSRIILSSRPIDIVKLPENKLAVALINEKSIQIISYTEKNLSKDRRIHVGERCNCLAYSQGKLVIGCNCNPGKLIILNLDGNLIQAFDTPGLFDGLEKIIISNDEKFLYVSEYVDCLQERERSNCLKVDWQGNVKAQYEQPGYVFTKGIQEIDDGTFLVCYQDSHNIVRLTNSFEKCEIEDSDSFESYLRNPRALWYNKSDRTLYVSCSLEKAFFPRSDAIKVFSIEWT